MRFVDAAEIRRVFTFPRLIAALEVPSDCERGHQRSQRAWDMYDRAGGKFVGRRSADDITFFKNAGGGHLDLMTAEVILAQTEGRS
jgi:hypothetical protein